MGAGLPWVYQSLSNSKIQSFYHFKCWHAKVKAILMAVILFLFIRLSFEICFFTLALPPFYRVKIPLGSPLPITLSNLLPWYPQRWGLIPP